MIRRVFVALVLSAGLAVMLPLSAHAGSAWGEVSLQITSGSSIVRLVGRRDATSPMNAYRLQHKNADQPWSSSHAEGAGISASAFSALRTQAEIGQTSFDTDATGSFGTWFGGHGSEVRGLLRDVTRRTSATAVSVRLQSAGNSGQATLGDLEAMSDAILVNDRAAFDAAAEIAWGSWYTGLGSDDTDLVYGVIIDLTGAG